MKKIAIVLATGFAALLPLAAVTVPTPFYKRAKA